MACLTIFRMGYAQPALDKISSTTRREIRKATGSDCQRYGINIGFIKLMQLLQSPQIQAFRSRTLTDALCNQSNDGKIKKHTQESQLCQEVPNPCHCPLPFPLPLSPVFQALNLQTETFRYSSQPLQTCSVLPICSVTMQCPSQGTRP